MRLHIYPCCLPIRSTAADMTVEGQQQDGRSSTLRTAVTTDSVGSDRVTGETGGPQQQRGSHAAGKHCKPTTTFPRVVVRNLAFNQSINQIRVAHNQRYKISLLVKHDLFHVLMRLKTHVSLLVMLCAWTIAILVFAGIYVGHNVSYESPLCHLGPNGEPITFRAGFAFALQTATTVGYTLPSGSNAFFNYCPGLQIVIYFQMVLCMMFNAFIFAFFYSRVARADKRAVQVVFSDKAIVSNIADQVRFQVRIYDVDAAHPVVEAHVRLYALMKERPVPRPLRVLQPTDDSGARMFLSFPSVVSHHVDLYSILHPPVCKTPVPSDGIGLRQVDSETENRKDVICPICATSFGNYDRWLRHVRYQQIAERVDGQTATEVTKNHLALTEPDEKAFERELTPVADLVQLKNYFKENIAEIVVLAEGIDPLMSGTFQAMQSYRFEDVVWHETAVFHPCVSIDQDAMRVDLDRFHDIDIPSITSDQRKRYRQHSHRIHDCFLSTDMEDLGANPTTLEHPCHDVAIPEGDEAKEAEE